MSRRAGPMARRILVVVVIAALGVLINASIVLAGPSGSTVASAISLTTNQDRDFRASGGYKGIVSGTGCASPDGHAVWFTWDATSTTTFSASTIGSAYDTVVFVYDSGMNQIACNDDFDFGTPCPAASTTNHCSKAVFSATIGETYYIAVTAFDSERGGKGRILVSD
jgi:hypothetical protein